MSPSGEGLVRMLDALNRNRAPLFERIEAALADFVPEIRRIAIKETNVWVRAGGSDVLVGERMAEQPKIVKRPGFSLSFVTRRGWTIPASDVSDGVMLFLAYLTIVSVAPEGKSSVLLVEEPENGIHPRALRKVIEFFKGASEGARGLDPVQIFLTTHSPYIVDFCDPKDVVLVHRDDAEGTVGTPLSDVSGVDKLLREQYVGELWFNVGEEDLVGKAKKSSQVEVPRRGAKRRGKGR